MITVVGIYPNRNRAAAVRHLLEEGGPEKRSVTLHTRDDMARIERILSLVTPLRTNTRTGLVIGVLFGAIAGFLGGMAIYPVDGEAVPSIVYGLAGMAPFAVLGGYLGSLYGSRIAENPKMNIKERVWNDDAVLVVARVHSREENLIVQSMIASDGEYIVSREVDSGAIETILESEDGGAQ